MQRRTVLHILFAGALRRRAVFVAQPALAAESEIYVNSATGEAINGYDPVAYFTEDKPVKGDPAYHLRLEGRAVPVRLGRRPRPLRRRPGEIRAAIWRLVRLCHGREPVRDDRAGSLDGL